MPRKKFGQKGQKSKQSPSWLKLALFLIIIICGYYLFEYFRTIPLISQKSDQPPSATSSGTIKSAQVTPTPKPTLSIPTPAGKSVRVPILTYHYIGNNPNPADKVRDNLEVTPNKFEEEMSYLAKSGYNTITFDTLYAGLHGQASLPGKPIILTFDDGYIDFYVNAYPILRRYGLHAVSFIPTGLMGQGYYMSWAQIKEINATGLVSFQAHSITHPNLTSLTNDQLKYQIFESKRILEAQLGKKVNTFAYPYGASDGRVWQAVKDAGFIGAVGTWGGVVESEGTIYDMPRIKISGGIDLKTFISRL